MKSILIFFAWLASFIMLSLWLAEPISEDITIVMFWAVMTAVSTIVLVYHCTDKIQKNAS